MTRKPEKNTPLVALTDHRLEDSSKISFEFRICPLKDPRTSETRQYLLHQSNSKIYEVQSVSHPKSSEYSSFFVSNQVISNKDLHTITPVDPLYFLLSHFEQEEKWQPWDQMVQSISIPQAILEGLEKTQLKHVFEVNDSYGNDLILYKLKHHLVLSWLEKKVENIKRFVMYQMDIGRNKKEMDLTHNSGAVSSSFHLGDTRTNTNQEEEAHVVSTEGDSGECISTIASNTSNLTPSEQNFLLKSSLQIICEYLSPFWTSKLLAHYKLSEVDLHPIKKSMEGATTTHSPMTETLHNLTPTSSTTSSSISQTYMSNDSVMSEADKLLHYTMGESGNSFNEAENLVEAKKRKLEATKSVALKKLEKVNTKGMKSMMSFFGSAKKK